MLDCIQRKLRRTMRKMGIKDVFGNKGTKVNDAQVNNGFNGVHHEPPKVIIEDLPNLETETVYQHVQEPVYKAVDWEDTERKLNDEISNLGMSDNRVVDPIYTGQLKEMQSLVGEFADIQGELGAFAEQNLEDKTVFSQYKDVVAKQVDILDQIKQHTANYVSELTGLEAKTFTGLDSKNTEVIGEANDYNRQLGHYESICDLIDDLIQDSSRSKGLIDQQTKGHKNNNTDRKRDR